MFLDRGGAKDLLIGGDAGLDLEQAVGAESADISIFAHFAESLDGGSGDNGVEHVGVGGEQFVDADTARVAGIAAFFAAFGVVEIVKGAGGFLDDVADVEGGIVLFAAVATEFSHEPLCDDAAEGRGEEIGFDAHVDEADDGGGGVVGVEGGEDEVAGEGGLNADACGFGVADFADHDDIGVLAEE